MPGSLRVELTDQRATVAPPDVTGDPEVRYR
jgi:hypothetical protein